MSRYRKRPVEIDAVQWTGGDYDWLNTFAGHNWGRADAHDVQWDHDDTEEVIVWNSLERLWIPVPVGHWIIRGVRGELYPCEPAVFAATYEPVGGSDTPADQPDEDELLCEHGLDEPHAFMERRQRDCEMPEGWCAGPVLADQGEKP